MRMRISTTTTTRNRTTSNTNTNTTTNTTSTTKTCTAAPAAAAAAALSLSLLPSLPLPSVDKRNTRNEGKASKLGAIYKPIYSIYISIKSRMNPDSSRCHKKESRKKESKKNTKKKKDAKYKIQIMLKYQYQIKSNRIESSWGINEIKKRQQQLLNFRSVDKTTLHINIYINI